ncbi:hypothetical protein BZG36_00731 [Bifiguratus adelaidae]|uniref:Actin-related protein 2/3 complex subunit n=1 Tax=Bifiguratus adelaidae TaxID=1938954 RepID=A0A261Y724_9FUNG|nr:hypothetical protein BZG36_00731 [Bifiguratus adelaidae]
MPAPQVHQIGFSPITAHSFNGDRSEVILCQNTSDVQIYDTRNWTVKATLADHDKVVTSIDVAPNSNRIVTCSQDRNAYVWNYDGQQWKPTLVLLRINRAATYVRWSPNEDKFAVASGARVISICYFEEDNDWWVSKHLKKPIRSTVLSLDWHPNNVLLAAGSADTKARVFSAFIKGVDAKPQPTVWGDKLPFNTVCGEFANSAGGWVHSVAFSPSGDALAFTSHDSSVNIVYPVEGQSVVLNVNTSGLPFMTLFWPTEEQIVAAGHDCVPFLFSRKGDQWALDRSLDEGNKKATAGSSVFAKFKQMDLRGQDEDKDTNLNSVHQNTITELRPYSGQRGATTEFSTSGVDGKICIWHFS